MSEEMLAAPVTQESPENAPAAPTSSRPSRRTVKRIPLWLMLALTLILLFFGASKSFYLPDADATEYQCYALTFWGGAQAQSAVDPAACAAFLGTATPQPFHTLPQEYGPLALLAFSLPALGPVAWYPTLFAIEMLLVVVGIALLLARIGRSGAGQVWLLYTLMGSMALAAARFDVVPAACTLLALVALRARRHSWAYLALALGALFKFYPALLLPLLLIESWRWRREIPLWRGPAIFAGTIALVEGLAAALAGPNAALAPLRFMSSRCVQVESLPATLAFLWGRVIGGQPSFTFSYGAMCQSVPGAPAGALLANACLALAGVAFVGVLALRWRGRVGLGLAAILLLCLAMLGSKVLSPQYLLWVSPLVAWEYGLELRALLAWGAVCLATTLCFPLSYDSLLLPALHTTADQLIPPTAALRNLLLLALVGIWLWRSWRPWRFRRSTAPSASRTAGAI